MKPQDTLISSDGKDFFRSDEMFSEIEPDVWIKGNELAKRTRYTGVRSRLSYMLTTFEEAMNYCERVNGGSSID